MIEAFPSYPEGTIPKRCPFCHKGIAVNPAKDQDVCPHCGESYLITHTLSSGSKAGNSRGIRLKLVRKTQVCCHCHEEKPLRFFWYGRCPESGLSTRCSKCTREINRKSFKKYAIYRGITV